MTVEQNIMSTLKTYWCVCHRTEMIGEQLQTFEVDTEHAKDLLMFLPQTEMIRKQQAHTQHSKYLLMCSSQERL